MDHKNQLDVLTRERGWFIMPRSIIIVTTRYEVILDQIVFGVDYKYELKELDEVQSLHLFNRHAFHNDCPPSDFEDISRDVISTTEGLLLALEVIGSYLYMKSNMILWKDVLKILKKEPHREVQEILRISYDTLECRHPEIFLDIACFFIGTDTKFSRYMWED